MARRAKNKAGKRSKSKQLDKIVIGKVSFPSNTNNDFSPWHYFASFRAEVRQSEGPIPKIPCKESFLTLFYDTFLAKVSVSRAFLEP